MAKPSAKPAKRMSTMQSASTAHAPSARPAPRQSIAALFGLPIASAAASTIMASPYQRGKNAGPGPSVDRYSHPLVAATMYTPSATSASPDQKSGDRRNIYFFFFRAALRGKARFAFARGAALAFGFL